MNKLFLTINTENGVIKPIVEEGITWETERKSSPGKLTFKVVKDDKTSFQEGDVVSVRYDDKDIFFGFVFNKKRDKNQLITVTAYDQLRYLKNKDTYSYSNMTASSIIKMIANDFHLNLGTIEDTSFIIEKRRESNKTLFDIIQLALDITLINTNRLYVLYDDFGKLSLKNIESMKVDLVIGEDGAEDFDYETSIDKNTYNQVKLSYDNKKEKKREIYIARDSSNINRWGLLQYYESVNDNTNAKSKTDSLLNLYNRKTRNLSIKNAFGDIRVRAGSSVVIHIENLGDISVKNFMVAEKVKHTFKNDEHMMDLTLRGDDFDA